MEVRTDSLKPNPINALIYNDSADDKLIDSIDRLGILQPLVVTRDGTIISGHRRWSAAVYLEKEFVPVRVIDLTDRLDIQEAMIEANRQREKTEEQLVQEVRLLRGILIERGIREKQKNLPGSRESSTPETPLNTCANSALESHPDQSGSLIHFGKNDGLHENGITGRVSGKSRSYVAKSTGSSERSVRAIYSTDDTIDELRGKNLHKEADELDYILRKTNPTRAEKKAKELRMRLLKEEYSRNCTAYVPPTKTSTDTSIHMPPAEKPIEESPVEASRDTSTLLPCIDCECTDMFVIQGAVSCNRCGMTIQWYDTDNDRAIQRWNRIAQKCNRRTS